MGLQCGMLRKPSHWQLYGVLATLTLLAACSETGDNLSRIIERGELRLVTRNGPSTYFVERDEPRGF